MARRLGKFLLLTATFYLALVSTTFIYNFAKAKILHEEIRFGTVYGVMPYMEICVKELHSYSCGETIGPIIYLDKVHWNDLGTRIHEQTHVKQSYRGLLFINDLRYRFDPEYASRAEKEAEEAWITEYRRIHHEDQNSNSGDGNGINFWTHYIISLPSFL